MRQKPTKTKENPGAPDNFGRTLEARVHTNMSAVNEIINSDTFLAEQAQNQANTERARHSPRYAGEFIVGS